MFDIFNAYATDETLEEQGTWFPMGTGRVLVARAGNMNFSRAVADSYEKNRVVLEKGDDEADELSKKLMVDAIARHILKGWEGLGYKGKPIEYSVENAAMLLGHREFRRAIDTMSNDVDAYRMKLEEDQGNA